MGGVQNKLPRLPVRGDLRLSYGSTQAEPRLDFTLEGYYLNWL